MTVQNQLRWGGLVAVVAGALFIIGAALRGFGLAPLLGQWVIFVYIVLAFFGFTALYAVQARRIGNVGLAGYILVLIGLGFSEVIAFLIVAQNSGLVAEAHAVQMFAWGRAPILHLAILFNTVGGILFGIGTMRARMLPRWTGAVFIAGQLLNFLNEYLFPMPQLMIVPAVLLAAGLAGMGWAVWFGKGEAPAQAKLAIGG